MLAGLGVAGVLFLVVGLLLSIALHELGHFVPARKFGSRVSEFMVGFGPKLFSVRRGETDYGMRAVPLGGYIRILGMFPPGRSQGKLSEDARARSSAELGADDSSAFWRLPPYKRIIVMTGGPLMNLAIWLFLSLMLLLLIGLPGLGREVASVQQCVPSASGELVSQCAIPSPATAAGVLPGDVIVRVGGVEVSTWEEGTSQVKASPAGMPLDIVVLRDGREVPLTATPVESPLTPGVSYLGISGSPALVRQPVSEVPGILAGQAAAVGSAIALFPYRVLEQVTGTLSGESRDVDGPIGVVGIGRLGGEVASLPEVPFEFKLVTLLSILAGLNLALFAFNMLPLLPLDGGHVAAAGFESVRRRWARWRARPDPGPVDLARLLPFSYGVAMVVITLSLMLFYVDVVNPIRISG